MGQKLLLDTHTLIWWRLDPKALSATALESIRSPENDVYFSSVSAMEIATKVRLGKLEVARPLATNFARQMLEEDFEEVCVTSEHAEFAGGLLMANQDPWDRLLLAQAHLEQMRFVTADGDLGSFAGLRLW